MTSSWAFVSPNRYDNYLNSIKYTERGTAFRNGNRELAVPKCNDKITYTLALLKTALHPNAARAFWDFILTGNGKNDSPESGRGILATPRAVTP